jgi:putative transposase
MIHIGGIDENTPLCKQLLCLIIFTKVYLITRWNCKYHVVFIPKRRKKVLFINIRKELGKVFHELAKQKESQIHEGSIMSDHVYMCISIPPKYAVASVIGFMKGKSAIAIARMQGRQRNFTGAHFWARGYAVSTDLI